jgi:asparagine synthase (glutamine-hydrolysing)
MCGIAGYRTRRTVDPQTLDRMVGTLIHRGPDGAGFHRAAPFAGGMRRLSINDPAHGDQPLFNADRTVALLYNGEIYNYPELRRELEARGHHFTTRSDGEVICHLYDEMGEDLFERLDGMFAAALWVEPAQKLILARDLPGEKPLYYAEPTAGEVVFASEPVGLTDYPGVDLSLNPQALWDFPSFLWIPEPDTVYRGVRALPRGHLLIVDDAGLRLRPYANRFNTAAIADDDESVVAETRRVVSEAVRSRLLSDVPVGAFLSGGLDSSIVVTLARGALDQLTTFSIGFEDADDPYHGRADESAAAAAYARQLGTVHHEIRVTAADFRADLENFCRHGGEPFAVSSGLGILAVARAARAQGIKVLLSGDGADELFGGYSWYPHLPLTGVVAAASPPAGPLSFQNFGVDLNGRLAALAGYPPPLRAWAWHYYAAESEKAELFHPDLAAQSAGSLRHFAALPDPAGPVDYIRHDRGFYLPFEMMRKLDRMTMACSVEGRAPFVAPAVLSHAEKLGFGRMVRGDTLKWALRRAFADILPAEITERPKHGFNVPIDHWLKGEWADLPERAFCAGSALDRAGLLRSGAGDAARRMLHDPQRLNGHTIFCYIMLNLWLENRNHGNYC